MNPNTETITKSSAETSSCGLISVCIANFNGAEYIEQCITSVLNQVVKWDVEILIHDDASIDESVALIRRRFPCINIIESTENVGFCISNNRMVSRSRGKYILLLNNDAVLRPGSLNRLLTYAEESENPQILGLPQYSITDGTLVDRGYEFDIFMNPIPSFISGVNDVSMVTGACLWIPRIVWDDVGGLPDWFESVAEDAFICQAAILLGYSIVILDFPGFDHWIGRNLGGGKLIDERLVSTTRRRALSERNKTFVMMICYPLPLLLVLFPVHFSFLAIEAATLFLSRITLRKLRLIYISLPGHLLKQNRLTRITRQHIQSKRRIRFACYLQRFHWVPWKLKMLLQHGLPKVY